MKQEFVTLPREVVEQAIEALFCTDSEEWSTAYENELKAVKKLRAALDQQQNHVSDAGNMVPTGWKLVPVEPNCSMVLAGERPLERHDFLRLDSAYRAMLADAPKPPAPGCKATKRGDHVVCDDCKSAWDANDKNPPACVPVPPAVEQPQGEPSTVAFCHVGDVVVCDNDSLLRQLGVKRSDKLYLHPQDLNCKSKQALLATLLGYTKEQPKRKPLTDEQIDAIADAMPGGLEGFMKGWGWRQFASAVIEATHNIK